MKLNWVQWLGLIILVVVVAIWIFVPDLRRWGAAPDDPPPADPAPVITEEAPPGYEPQPVDDPQP